MSEEGLSDGRVPVGASIEGAQGQNHAPRGGCRGCTGLLGGVDRGGEGGAMAGEEGQASWRDEVAGPHGVPRCSTALGRGVWRWTGAGEGVWLQAGAGQKKQFILGVDMGAEMTQHGAAFVIRLLNVKDGRVHNTPMPSA